MATPLPPSDPAQLTHFAFIIERVLNIVARLLGIAVFIMLVVGGYQLLTAAGDPKKVEAAQKTITAAIIGIAIVIGGWFFLLILQNITGANLVNLSVCILGQGTNCT